MSYSNYPSANPQDTPPPAEPKKENRNLIYGLLIAALLGTWGYIIWDKSKTKEMTTQLQSQLTVSDSSKNAIQTEYNSALQRLDELTTMNSSMDSLVRSRNSEITSMKSRIQTLLNKQNRTAADLAEAKRLITELNSKISGFVQEIEVLRGENLQLKNEKETLITEKQNLQQEYDQTKEQKQQVEEKLNVASTLNATNINIVTIDERKSGKEVEKTRAKRVDLIRLTFNVFNRVGDDGTKEVFTIITDPNGQVISNEALGSGRFTTRDNGEQIFTKKANVTFTAGKNETVTIEWKPGTKFTAGIYKVAIYNNGFKIGEGSKSLK
jgi:multidrug efflux pump subunit AcrA (membrane-fusion protein)